MLFNKVSIFDVFEHRRREAKQRIQSLDPNYILNRSEADVVGSILDELRIDLPSIQEDSIHIDYGERQIDVSRDPMRFVPDPSVPFYVQGTRITFIVPFAGDGSFFDVQPQHFSYSLRANDVALHKDGIHFNFASANLNAAAAKRDFESELQQIKTNLQSLRQYIDQHEPLFVQEVRNQVQQRKAKLLQDAQMVASLGYPIKRREGAPTTYAVPVSKRKADVRRPTAVSQPFSPEPTLSMDDYEGILNIVRNMVQVMERSPKVFENMGEEDLRTHFLVQLNGQFEGRATGETFNYQGKTDILIREEGKNVFIAECKFWDGEKAYSGTLDQLLSYLSWRDTKAAALIFNRNVNFSEVVQKIADITPEHTQYKRSIGKLDETSYRFVFGQPNDPAREVIVTVMAFDIPRGHRN